MDRNLPRLTAILAVSILLAAAVSPVELHAEDGARFQSVAADTVRTNLWLIEALMREAAVAAIRALPPAPADVRLEPEHEDPQEELFTQVALQELEARGYSVYLGGGEDAETAEGDYILTYRVADVDLDYPQTGRRLGIWREWIARRLEVTVVAELTERASGRLLFSDRVVRSYGDRVPDEDWDAVESGPDEFTKGTIKESGWQRRLEEIVVLATLTGLVAVYFANTQ
jgi:hypothetical protein